MPSGKTKSHHKKGLFVVIGVLIIAGYFWAFPLRQTERPAITMQQQVVPEAAQEETNFQEETQEESSDPVFQIADLPVLKSVVEVEVETKPLLASQLKEYALKLHDALLTNKNCLDTWQALQTEPFPMALLIQLEGYCWDSAPMNGVYQAFMQGAQTRPTTFPAGPQGIWTRIKAALWPFHRVQTPGEDFITQATLAMEQKDIPLAVHLLEQADVKEQQAFKDFFIKAHLYEQAQKNLDAYLLSF